MYEKNHKETIFPLIGNKLLAGGVHRFDSIDSTNTWALKRVSEGRALPFACVADHQSQGRGRRGRHWLSPAGANIYMSLAWHFEMPVEDLGMISLAQGGAVIRALEKIGINNAWLKWPNDVLIEDRKIAGVLVEASGVRATSCNVVAGIGLNYRMPDNILGEVGASWTDVAHSLDDALPLKAELTAILLDEMVQMCRRYQLEQDTVIQEIEQRFDVLKGQRVTMNLENGRQFEGTVLGINDRGELRVEVDGREMVFNSADVSLSRQANRIRAGDAC